MSNGEKPKHDIYDRIFDFIVNVLDLVNKLPRTYSNQVICNQITRSATSMGANSQEADGVNSKKDFLHCLTITRKEGKETIYWLRLVEKLNTSQSNKSSLLQDEGKEIILIISSIIKNTLNNSKS